MRILFALTVLASAFVAPKVGPDDGPSPRPNFLVVITDDQRFDQLGCAGHPVLQTPVMDSLAERGVRFSNAFVTTPICAASRASLMTGRWEGSHGYTFGQPPMGPDIAEETYFARLRKAGYRTTFAGKWGVKFSKGERGKMLDHIQPMGAPYLREKGDQRHLTIRTADAAISQLPNDASEGPFCMTVSFNAPHAEDPHPDQYIPPPDLVGMYKDSDVPVPPYALEGFEALPPFLQESLGRRRWGWRFDTREKQVRRTKDYWTMISGVDRALGRILGALEERGLSDNTIVLLMGDNGYFLGERGLAGKWLIYEESIRVPLIVYDPRPGADSDGGTVDFASRVVPPAEPGSVLSPIVLNVDVAPTLLDFAGLMPSKGCEGRSLLPLLRRETTQWRSDFLVEHRMVHPEIPMSVGVRGSRWVYALYDQQEPPYEQLFDLANDPNELRNLAGDEDYEGHLLAARARCAALRKAQGGRAK